MKSIFFQALFWGTLALSCLAQVGTEVKQTKDWVPFYEKSKKQISQEKSSTKPPAVQANLNQQELKELLLKRYKTKEELRSLKKVFLSHGKQAVPVLVEAMKGKNYPASNRWVSTYMLAMVAGKKASPFIAKFLQHPEWYMRLVSLKVLMLMKENRYSELYAKRLYDESLIVRTQAIETIRALDLKKHAPQIWQMFLDEKNYNGEKGQRKRVSILNSVITTIGDLGYNLVLESLFKMMQKSNYRDLHQSIDYALAKLTGEASPNGKMEVKRHFWSQYSMKAQKF